MQDQIYKLPDGRDLSYSTYGPLHGLPVIYFHGTPSSRLEPLLINNYGNNLESLLEKYDLRLIAIERPGMGKSSFNLQNSFLSFAADVKELLQHLEIKKCSLLCWSGGGPYALAMAFSSSIISGVYIICGFARQFDKDVFRQMGTNKIYFLTAKRFPWFLELSLKIVSKRKSKRPIPQWLTGLSYVDYMLLHEVDQLEWLSKHTVKEAVIKDTRGAVEEAKSYFKPLGFKLKDIKQKVHYWWGTKDSAVVQLHAEAIEEKVPNAVMHYREGEGHLSLYIKAFEEILQTIKMEAEQETMPIQPG
jgi:pimeloyl-ACP methyl ester carboxylesterase